MTLIDGLEVPVIQVQVAMQGSSAANAGIQKGDLIYAFNGRGFPERVNGGRGLSPIREMIGFKRHGAVVTLDVMRGDKKMKFDVTLVLVSC